MSPTFTLFSGKLCKPGSTGQAYYGVSNKILSPDSEQCGEIVTKSRNIFMGYNDNEAKTKESFTEVISSFPTIFIQ